MTDHELRSYLLGVLDSLARIPCESRDRLRLNRKSETQDEFRLNLFLDAIAIVESDFLKPQKPVPENIIPLSGNTKRKGGTLCT